VPTHEPTAQPTATPTFHPTEPTHLPTHTPTEVPTNEPTGLPSDAPTHAPSALPTMAPSHAPSGCIVRAAKMHILFRQNVAGAGRRLLSKVSEEVTPSATNSPGDHKWHLENEVGYQKTNGSLSTAEMNLLHQAVADALQLPSFEIAAKSYVQDDGVMHTEFRFMGPAAIKLGYELEMKVLTNVFNPLPSYPIHKLYLEEIFDCGKHAIGVQINATGSPYSPFIIDDNNGFERTATPTTSPSASPTEYPTMPITSDPTLEPTMLITRVPTDTPTSEPTIEPTALMTAYPTFVRPSLAVHCMWPIMPR
jgi:hypothetical protein